jgi:hypothetical protein
MLLYHDLQYLWIVGKEDGFFAYGVVIQVNKSAEQRIPGNFSQPVVKVIIRPVLRGGK